MNKKRPQKRISRKLDAVKSAGKELSKNMEDFHCDMFDIKISITDVEFDKAAFLKAIGVENESEYIDEDGHISMSLPFASRKAPSKQHAHIRFLIYKDKSGQATLNYHQTGTKTPQQQQPPYLEDCAQWFGGFFKRDVTPAVINAIYDFGKEFTPTIPLPFPLVTSSKELSGLKVAGLSLAFPEDSPVDTAIVQRDKESVYLFLQKNTEIKLKEFDLRQELEKLNTTVKSLVRQEKSGERNKKTNKA